MQTVKYLFLYCKKCTLYSCRHTVCLCICSIDTYMFICMLNTAKYLYDMHNVISVGCLPLRLSVFPIKCIETYIDFEHFTGDQNGV